MHILKAIWRWVMEQGEVLLMGAAMAVLHFNGPGGK